MTQVTQACVGKRQFGTFGDARTEAKRLRRSYKRPCNPYHCASCGHYHVGEDDRRRMKR